MQEYQSLGYRQALGSTAAVIAESREPRTKEKKVESD